jgi:hypothetical protein
MQDLMHLVKDGDAGPRRPGQPAGLTLDIQAGYSVKDQDRDMQAFFAKREAIKRDMASIAEKLRDIGEMHERSKYLVQRTEVQQHREAMQVGMQQFQEVAILSKVPRTSDVAYCMLNVDLISGKLF